MKRYSCVEAVGAGLPAKRWSGSDRGQARSCSWLRAAGRFACACLGLSHEVAR